MHSYLTISGFFFGFVALLHLVRLLQHLPAVIGSWTVPFWVSAVGVLVPGTLALWAFRLVRRLAPGTK